MAEVLECPACGEMLNLDLRDAVICGIFESTLLYRCEKCGAIFTEDGEVLEQKEAGR